MSSDALTALSESEVVNHIEKASRLITSEINLRKWSTDINKEIEYRMIPFMKMLDYFETVYSEQFGKIKESNYWIINTSKVCSIISKDLDSCKVHKVDINKGILLYGGKGVGKTTIMKSFAIVLQKLNNPMYESFITVPSLKLVSDYSKEGDVVISRYSKPLNEGLLKNSGFFFDDIGNEQEKSHFGSKSNVMQEIIEILYNRNDMKGKVHVSTNLDGKGLKDRYGERVYSRMKEMFNFITFPADAKDMRQ